MAEDQTETMQKTKKVAVGSVTIGAGMPLVLIAGPCVIESEKSALEHAEALVRLTDRHRIPFIYKSSYDKANRTSVRSFRGPGIKRGLAILRKVRRRFNVPVVSDVHAPEEAVQAAAVLDLIQVPAFLSRQTDLLVACGRTGKPVNVKKGQFLAPEDMRHAVGKIESTGNRKILLTERGVSFGYHNLVSDFRSLLIMKRIGYPVVYDATHSVQIPGGRGSTSGGERQFVAPLALASVACGTDALFLEVHRTPRAALSDGPNMLSLKELDSLLNKVRVFADAVREAPWC